jgi:hypothetical protein
MAKLLLSLPDKLLLPVARHYRPTIVGAMVSKEVRAQRENEKVKRREVPTDLMFWERVAGEERVREVVMNGEPALHNATKVIKSQSFPFARRPKKLRRRLSECLEGRGRNSRTNLPSIKQNDGYSPDTRAPTYHQKTGFDPIHKRSVHSWIYEIILVQFSQIQKVNMFCDIPPYAVLCKGILTFLPPLKVDNRLN